MPKVNGIGVAAVAGGGLLLYSAINGKNFSGVIRSLLTGQSPSTAGSANPINFNFGSSGNTGPSISNNVGSTTATPSSQSANVKIVQTAANALGWGSGAQWDALVKVINRESGFDNNAQNHTSTAYGIFQFLDTTWATVGATKTSNPLAQTIAGLAYIKERYGNPENAWAHEQQFGWY